jgi:phosphoribosylamine--glycine ligase
MITRAGVKVIEYNARFGDPEIMNVLPLMQTDFIDVCDAIVRGRLNSLDVKFASRATVCKYIVPEAYPGRTSQRPEIDVQQLDQMASTEPNLRVFYGAVEQGERGLCLTGSRAIGLVGIGSSLADAERLAERAATLVKGPVKHRRDIGTAALVQKRVNHMTAIRRSATTGFARAAI